MIEDHDLLKKYNTIWNNVCADIKKELDTEPVYNEKVSETKTISHRDEVTHFYKKEIPKVDSNHTLKKDENYYPQMFLKE